MKSCDMNQTATACTTLLILCIVLWAMAEKSHWNPASLDDYHEFTFITRPEGLVSKSINYSGYTFAGRGEFPWLVEIRGNATEDFDKENEWSNGNLVSSKFILTVCTAVVDFKKFSNDDYRKDPMFVGLNLEMTYLSVKNPKFYKVLFSDDYTYKSVINGFYTGTRQIKKFHPHPKCNNFELDYQWGVVEILRPIWPVPPWTAYMPIKFEKDGWAQIKRKFVEVTDAFKLEKSAPCNVGLWSRKLTAEYKDEAASADERLYENTKMRNYKVRYSVVPMSPLSCWNPPGINAFPDRFRTGETVEEWECMAVNFNESFGTVCDHDRGAPIVCDGVVRAIVLAGATPDYCNMKDSMPFLVLDLKYAMDMFAETSSEEWNIANLRSFLRIDSN